MDKYLQQILHEINTIIIPGLGALTVTKKDSMDLMFMPFLKHDDGTLSKIISEKEGITLNDAKNLISKYVRDINFKLDKGESYDMYLFGKFYKENGEIHFKNWKDYNSNILAEDNFVILNENKESSEIENNKIEKNNSDNALSSILEKGESEKTEEIIINNNQGKDIDNNTNYFFPFENIENENDKLEDEIKNEKKITEQELENQIKNDSDENLFIRVKKKKTISFFIIIFLILFLSVSSVTYYIFNKPINKFISQLFNSSKNILKNSKNENIEEKLDSLEKQVSQIENNELEVNELEKKQNIETDVKETKSVSVENKTEINKQIELQNSDYRNKYHLIVGGFLLEENASRFAKKLNSENGKALMLGKFNDKFLVSYTYFNTKEEAVSEMRNIPLSSWVFFY